MHHRWLVPALMALLSACASQPHVSDSTSSAVETSPSTYLQGTLHGQGVLIGGQPTSSDLQAIKDAGITRVINLRTPEEMQALDFDEAARLAGLGIELVSLPLGGKDYAYTPELLATFAAQMQDTGDGQLLLHCASGGRAGLVYAAWLVKYQGYTPDQALRTLSDSGGWPLPLEKLLGRPLTVQFATP